MVFDCGQRLLASVYVQRKSTISGGVPNKVLNGEAPPRCPNPLTLFFSIFDRKSTPFEYTFYSLMVPLSHHNFRTYIPAVNV